MSDRALGTYLGQYIGDALGARYEFLSRGEAEKLVANDRKIISGFLPILGGGHFNVTPGQVTDDTELASALTRSLYDKKQFDADDVANNYRTWFTSSPFGVGSTTHKAFSGLGPEEPWFSNFKRSACIKNGLSQSNGCLMRVSSIGIAGANRSDEWIIESAKTDTSMTHCRPEPAVATSAYCLAIAKLIRGGSPSDAYEAALAHAKRENCDTIVKNLADAKISATPIAVPTGELIDGDQAYMGYVGIALQFAFFELLHCSSFQKGLQNTVSRGGDADTNGCICGAILGARFGRAAIPKEWIKSVVNCKAKRYDINKFVRINDYEDVVSGIEYTK